MTARGSTSYTYNGDGTLVKQIASGVTTLYTQDLASPLTQILQTKVGAATATDYVYGLNRLASLNGSTTTWYAQDALGSVRRTFNTAATPLGIVTYDPWGTPESGMVPTFGFTGELQDATTGLVNLRARWYSTGRGTFTAFRWDTRESNDFAPYTHHPYAYALSNPVLYIDPTGKCVPEWVPVIGEDGCTIAEGAGKGRYDIVGAAKVVVAGGGVAATIVGCAATAVVGCVLVGAGAGAVTSWGNQALDNAGKPVGQAIIDVNWGTVARDAGIAAVSSGIGGAVGKGVGALCRTGPWCTTAVGAAIGSSSSGTYRILGNLSDGNPNTGATDGVLEACLVGGIAGGVIGRISYGLQMRPLNRAINAALNTNNPDRALEGKVASWLKDDIIAFQKEVGPNGSIGEIDIETPKSIIEVTTAPSRKLPQIQKLISDPAMNPSGKPVILYAPNYGKYAIRDIINAGGYVARTEAELRALLRTLGGP